MFTFEFMSGILTLENAEARVRRSRHWCFTHNNYTDDQYDVYVAFELPYHVVIGKEVGEEGTPHLQGYFAFKNAVTGASLMNRFPDAWFNPCVLPAKYVEYCKKDGVVYERGEPVLSGRDRGCAGGDANRNRWDHARQLAMLGKVGEIESELMVKHYRSFQAIAKDFQTRPDHLPAGSGKIGVWFYGSTGVGKSHAADVEYPGAYRKNPNKWWDGYQGESNVIIDDFDKSHDYLGYYLKIWADRYTFIAETKGSSLYIRPECFVVTSNWSPREIWENAPNVLEPILRRFRVVRFCSIMEVAGGSQLEERRPMFTAVVPPPASIDLSFLDL